MSDLIVLLIFFIFPMTFYLNCVIKKLKYQYLDIVFF